IVPAFNEEEVIEKVIADLNKYLSQECEIILVNDGSTDRTAEMAHKAGAMVLRHPINRGLGAALATGIEGALLLLSPPPFSSPLDGEERRGGVIITLDADGQHDGADIPRLIEPIIKGEAEVVIGSRFVHNPSSPPLTFPPKADPPRAERGGESANVPPLKSGVSVGLRTAASEVRGGRGSYEMPYSRRIANLCGNFFTWLLFGIWVSDSQSGFRAFSASSAAALRIRTSTMEVSSEIIREISRLKLKMVEVSIMVKYNEYSLSKGQGFLKGLETLWKLIVLKFFR
ncbi:MAG: glycosyltransferase family 2 protein, partial [bacterium]|nr:glycosyltransferase family 2 protein [bacterium]